MNREDAIRKIQKCMALGRSAEPHEAAAAMRQAQKLMQQFGVGEKDISLADVREVEARAVSAAANEWEVRLAQLVADSFGCELYTRLKGGYNDAGNFTRQRHYIFVGLDAAADVAAYAQTVLARQCSRARLAHIRKQPRQCKPITKTARGDAFAMGWVAGVRQMVERFAQPARDQKLLLDYMAQRHPNMQKETPRDASRRRSVDAGHFYRGHQAGQQAKLNRGVNGMSERALLT